MKYSLNKLWFHYTDEWYVTNGLAASIGLFDTLEAAEAKRKEQDRKSFRRMGSYDFVRDLTDFYEKTYQDTQQKLVFYFRSQGWESFLKEATYLGSTNTYWEFQTPPEMSDAQIDAILDITGASFHRIMEYKEVKEFGYVKVNYDFWGKKVFDKLKADGVLESRSPFLNGESQKGYYLVNKPPKGRKSAKFNNLEEGVEHAYSMMVKMMEEFPDTNYLGKHYVEDLSEEPELMMAFLLTCKHIQLLKTEVTGDNLKSIASKLKKLKSERLLEPGMTFFELRFPSFSKEAIPELTGFVEFLKTKPFEVFNLISEIAGETVHEYRSDSDTF